MYFLNYRELSHTTNFGTLLEHGKSLGASYLSDICTSRWQCTLHVREYNARNGSMFGCFYAHRYVIFQEFEKIGSNELP